MFFLSCALNAAHPSRNRRRNPPQEIDAGPACAPYNHLRMQLGSDVRPQNGLLAEMTLLAEKPRQGVPTSTNALHRGFGFVISSTSLGIIGSLYDEGIGSRSTGKERDTESGNDYMFARYYNSATGRFLSPDWSAKEEPVPYAKLDNPQSLNLYGYVLNNPLGKADPDGHDPWQWALPGGGVLAGAEAGAAGGLPGGPVGWAVGATIGAAAVLLHEIPLPKGPATDGFGVEGCMACAAAPSASHVQAGQKDADFVVTPGGTVVATDPGRVRDSLSNAPGVKTTPVTGPKGETGTIQTPVQTPNGPVDVRTMDGSTSHGPRTVITHPGTNSPKTPDGKATSDKNDNHIPNDHDRPGAP